MVDAKNYRISMPPRKNLRDRLKNRGSRHPKDGELWISFCDRLQVQVACLSLFLESTLIRLQPEEGLVYRLARVTGPHSLVFERPGQFYGWAMVNGDAVAL